MHLSSLPFLARLSLLTSVQHSIPFLVQVTKMKSAFLAMCFALAALLPAHASAEGPAADELIRNLSGEVLHILATTESLRAGNTTEVVGLVEQVVLPHFNFRRMTMLAVGRDWRAASPEQQAQLTDAFYKLLVRTYSNALTNYRNQTVRVLPLRANSTSTNATVQTEILQPGGQPVRVDYVLENRGDGWKIFDIVVAGVSLVSNYRGTFAQKIGSGGIDSLIDSLKAKEREVLQGYEQS